MALIEREAAIAAIREQGCLSSGYHSTEEIESDVVAMLEDLPAIDAAPVVHGQWEECDDDVNAWIRCPECGFEQDIDYFGDHRHEIEDYKLCPSCGARMDGGEEHEAD